MKLRFGIRYYDPYFGDCYKEFDKIQSFKDYLLRIRPIIEVEPLSDPRKPEYISCFVDGKNYRQTLRPFQVEQVDILIDNLIRYAISEELTI